MTSDSNGTAALAALVAARGLRRVLITNSAMSNIGGSQIVCRDLAMVLKAAGAEVTIATLAIAEPMRALCEAAGIALVSLRDTAQLPAEVDLVIGLHWPVVGAALLHCEVAFRHLVLVSLSPYEPVEALWAMIDRADLILVNSQENADAQRLVVADAHAAPRLEVLPNSLPCEWFADRPPPPQQLGTVLAVSYRGSARVAALTTALRGAGISVSEIGHLTDHRLVDPAMIDAHDAVLTIGHTAQKAMARGRPVFVYDRFGGPGWMTPDLVDRAEHFNFSGRGLPTPGRAAAATAFVEGFAAAADAAGGALAERAATRYRLEDRLAVLLARLEPGRAPQRLGRQTHAAAYWASLAFMSQALPGFVDPARLAPGVSRLALDVVAVADAESGASLLRFDQDAFVVDTIAGEAEIRLTGLLLWSTPGPLRLTAIDDDGAAYSADLGLPSPGLPRYFPDRADAAESRFRLICAVGEGGGTFRLVVTTPEGDEQIIGTIRAAPHAG